MSILNFEKLLAPVTEEDPCGEDLSDLTEYYVLEEYAKGKEETQFSEAEPPDWQQVEKLAKELLLQGKELWVISHLICALTSNHGAAGLNEGIKFLFETLAAFWEDIFPSADFDDDNPYEQRLNVLNSLSDMASPLALNIKNMPLCRSKQLGAFSYRDVLISRGEIKTAEDETPPEEKLIEAAIRDTNPEFISELIRLLQDTIAEIRKIEAFLNQAAGQQNNIANILKLEDSLNLILSFVVPYTTTETYSDEADMRQTEEDLSEDEIGKAVNLQNIGAPGEISSRDHVYALLGEMVQWYEKSEPASPVAMILARAQSMVGNDFFQIVSHIMGPDLPQLQELFGPSDGYPALAGPPGVHQAGVDIQSRQDILDWLDRTLDWYRECEPSSPVPLFIHRAKQLVGKNFQEIISEIANQAQDQVAGLLQNK